MKLYKKMNVSNTALVVIDIINSCAHERCEIRDREITFSKIRKMVPKLEEFIEEFRKVVGGLVIFVNTPPWRKEYLPSNINELYADPKACYYSKDTSGFSEQFYVVSPKKEDVIITKSHYDAFVSQKFRKILKEKGVRYLLITGIFADGCVLATICGGFSQGYNFVILRDLIETTDDEIRQKLQRLLKEFTWPLMYGKTITSEEFFSDWEKIKR